MPIVSITANLLIPSRSEVLVGCPSMLESPIYTICPFLLELASLLIEWASTSTVTGPRGVKVTVAGPRAKNRPG